MLEKEAERKMCPFYLVTNRNFVDDNCITTKCMMWRWSECWRYESGIPNKKGYSTDDGYCGLGGKP